MTTPQPYYPHATSVVPPMPAMRRSRAGSRLISGAAGFVLTPIALVVASTGGQRLNMTVAALRTDGDVLGAVLVLVGAALLLGVAALGALSSTGPVIGGVVWGVLPGMLMLVAPRSAVQLSFDAVGWLGRDAFGLSTWHVSGALLGIGCALVGAGIAAATARRKAIAGLMGR